MLSMKDWPLAKYCGDIPSQLGSIFRRTFGRLLPKAYWNLNGCRVDVGLDFLLSRIQARQWVNFLGEEKPDLLHEEFSVAVLMLRYMSIVYTKKDTVISQKT